MESFPAPLQEPLMPNSNGGSKIELQELLSTIGELHVSNRRMLMQIDQMAQVITQLREQLAVKP